VAGLPVVSVYESPFYGIDGWVKRAEDVVIGSLIMVLIAPFLLLIGLGIKLTSPGPVLFKQRRYGLKGEIVEVWKFRSMSVCDDGATVVQAQKNDARVTRFGAFLRRTSLDELPQFINVLQGQMSIVGPRPHAVAHNEQYRRLIHGYMLRHKVKPGITGWAQINGWRGETDTLDKMQGRVDCDLAYVRNWSLWLDIKIIFMTILKGFVGRNVY
jgi:putative colanic acid biosynthesis UDP-glucose lipid carrier transferase